MTFESRRLLADTFREVTLGLLGVFQLHDVDPDLVEDVSRMLARIYRARVRPDEDGCRDVSVQRLLGQLNQDRAPATGAA